MAMLVENARAKVNLTLRVAGRRLDGYHELASVVAFADCADRLTIEPAPDLKLVAGGPNGADCGDVADNLVIKAARLLGDAVAGLRVGRFTLDKHLPVAAGIGGGSADAAAALRLLARVNDLSVDDPRVVEAAGLTGADVPVCLASRSCVMTGIGEQLSPVDLPRMACVMVNPRVAVATGEVFGALGLKKSQMKVGLSDLVGSFAWPAPDAPAEKWLTTIIAGRNDLEAPAIQVQPVIAEVLAALRDAEGAQLARMSGSGATCFAIFPTAAEAGRAAQAIRAAQPSWWVHAGVLG